MITNEDIASYLVRLEEDFTEIQEGLWVLEDEDSGGMKIAIQHDPPVCTFRMKLMEVPASRKEELFARLLEFNASEMVSGAYGLEGNNIVVIETLQSENLDFNEFEAALETLVYAAMVHHPELSKYRY